MTTQDIRTDTTGPDSGRPRNAPLTGAEYIESLRDSREIYIYGEKVEDVTVHPAFRNSIRSVARLYDALHDPEHKDVLTTETDTGSGGYTHKFFRSSRSRQELVEARDAIRAWSRMSYGYMGRTPDFKATFLGTLGDFPDFYGDYADNARAWYREAQERMWFFNHAIVNPPVDRDKPVESNDVFVRVVRETDAGIVVNGAKMVATGSVLSNYTFVASFQPVAKEEYAVAFFADMGAPGVKAFSRPSYEMAAATTGAPFDYPLSSRFDENDAIIVFDDVLIPWENVLVYRDIERSNSFLPATGYPERALLHGNTRLATKLDFIAGLVLMATESAGTGSFRGVQANIGEILAWRQLLWSISEALVQDPHVTPGGAYLPNTGTGAMARVIDTTVMPRVKEIVQQIVAGGMIVQPSSALDFHSPEIRPYLDRYFRGSAGYDAERRNKVIKLLWDALGSEFGGRHDLYERNYSGNHEGIRIDMLRFTGMSGVADDLKGLVEQCMSDYDLDGWTGDTWLQNGDVTVNGRH
ncbi:4-hydroxyphenylacetate 3-monooxygenase oxygenase component [Actinomadura pelletieri DSM 43383]|uniref:4-hydroxyphenylacetate 3-monooxygenase oxygenase component n=1 Tax=Actinomadura pelletieri DSM 43383 TaxID=1120940 RepID=A0A495QXG5_9ACTN|nr:4-hydroxyphenylacetate 3-hydroxylase N-terminal domain-containing protein [Actinomadura pelletieri]RKS78757.1 4-hydroxyphenylacetate 3-monooxygenase oxygenase component [Actinomadura pelletieri DSM 43383]